MANSKEKRRLFSEWVEEALIEYNGKASLVDVAKMIWKLHGKNIQEMGDVLFTWQYDYRWAATALREKGIMKPANSQNSGIWELSEK